MPIIRLLHRKGILALQALALGAATALCAGDVGAAQLSSEEEPVLSLEARARAYELYLEAQELAAGGQIAQARALLEQVLEMDPDAHAVRARLARICLGGRDLDCAQREARRALAVSADELEARRVLAEVALQRYQRTRDAALIDAALEHLREMTRIAAREPWAWTVWVRVLALEGRLDEAEAVARAAEVTPGLDPSICWLALVRVLRDQGRRDEALALLGRVDLVGPSAAPVLALLAELTSQKGDRKGLADALERLRRVRPEDADVARRLGKVLAELGDFYGALDPLRAARRIRPADDLTSIELAGVLVRLGRGAEALALISELSPSHRSPHVYLLWARAAEQARQPGVAARRLVELVDRLGDQERRSFAPALLARAARDHLLSDEPAKALELAKRLGDDPMAWRLRMQALDALGRGKAGEHALRERFARRPEELDLLAVLVAHGLETRGLDAALEVAGNFVKERPSAAEVVVSVGTALVSWGHEEAAAALLDRFGYGRADQTRLLRASAAIYYSARRVEQARRLYERVLVANPEDASSLNDLCYLLATRGKSLSRALSLCERAVALRPDESAFLDSLGWVLHLNGRSEDGLAPLRKALLRASDESLAEIHEHLGDVYAALGQRGRALAEWQAAEAFAGGEDERLAEKIRTLEAMAEQP